MGKRSRQKPSAERPKASNGYLKDVKDCTPRQRRRVVKRMNQSMADGSKRRDWIRKFKLQELRTARGE